ncbi:Spermidine/putrescine-binding periplasmic protein [Rubellimicrobium thermophilum DSM 16684]|uniref:Spermidine/putrescine-binding periplasmic protein n=1 Tax=Rubellimicrobium thermophilum DSM 16684 TaxID=1123069 RepID=S9R6N2_9RHOB|nr:extracellular solute-binding protein [Rubellimicrobium thermophilum]EPX87618.1 Spermidine/putrescine-binding periplasmic protein [Rubellimicrobium thermophilum DSM 16684]
MTMTRLAAGAALALAAGPLFAQEAELPPCENCAGSMVIMSWGGAYQAAQLAAYVQPYIDATGVTVTWDESSGQAVAKLRAMSETGNVTADVVDVLATDAIRLCDDGLVMEIDYDEMLDPGIDGTPPAEDFGDNAVSECFVPTNAYSTTFAYRTDVAEWNGAVPDDICDIFDLEAFPGRRALERNPINNFEWALICDGVPAEEVYDVLSTPEGVDRALAKLDTIRDSVIWWTAGAETPQLLADGEVVIGSGYNGRLFSLIEEQGAPVAMLWDYEVLDLDGFVIPNGLPEDRLNRALHFLRFATGSQSLANLTRYISYGPTRASSLPLVGTHETLGIEMAPHTPGNPANNGGRSFLFNYSWWADHRDELDARFQSWLAR